MEICIKSLHLKGVVRPPAPLSAMCINPAPTASVLLHPNRFATARIATEAVAAALETS